MFRFRRKSDESDSSEKQQMVKDQETQLKIDMARLYGNGDVEAVEGK